LICGNIYDQGQVQIFSFFNFKGPSVSNRATPELGVFRGGRLIGRRIDVVLNPTTVDLVRGLAAM
jgi:hypothetical protein